MIVRQYPQEPFILKWGKFITLVLLIISGYGAGVFGWAVLQSDFYNLRNNVMNLQTPLSSIVLKQQAKLDELEAKQDEVKENLRVIERSGTTSGNAERLLLKHDIESLKVELTKINLRCSDLNTRVDAIQTKTVENSVMIQNLIDVINPHAPVRKR